MCLLCLLMVIFDVTVFAADCVVSAAVLQPFAYDLVTCLLNWCNQKLNV